MNAFLVAAITLACVFGGALLGRFLRVRLPIHHLGEDSKDIVKLAIGVVATMTALVLSLLVSSAKQSFDRMGDELTQTAAKVVLLDRALLQYGPDTAALRTALRSNYATVVDALVSQDESRLAQIQNPVTKGRIEGLVSALRELAPRDDAQRELRARAAALAEELNANRWLLVLQRHDSISTPLLVVVVFWLTLIFVGFGLFTPPHNATVVAALFLCALSVSGAIFLILEMDDPLTGLVRISDVPMRRALELIGHD
jgi:hypothetical protein